MGNLGDCSQQQPALVTFHILGSAVFRNPVTLLPLQIKHGSSTQGMGHGLIMVQGFVWLHLTKQYLGSCCPLCWSNRRYSLKYYIVLISTQCDDEIDRLPDVSIKLCQIAGDK